MDTALRRIDELSTEIGPLRTQLVNFARRQVGCQALQAHYGIGWLCAAIIWAEIGDARRFTSSDQLVRFAGLDVTVYSSDGKRSPGHLSRQGSPQLRWAAFEAAKCAARRGSPDYGYYHQLAVKRDGHNGKNPTLAVERKILRRSYHTLRELGDAALALPIPPPGRWPPNHALRTCPAHTDACGQLPQGSCRHPAVEWTSRKK